MATWADNAISVCHGTMILDLHTNCIHIFGMKTEYAAPVRIPLSVYDRLKIAAKANGRSVASLIVFILERWLKDNAL